MKSFSVTDLQLISDLSHLRMLDFINPENDKLIAPFLEILGFDTEYPVEFVPAMHRNLQGKVVIAYLVVGDINCNAAFRKSVWCTTEDRIIAAGYTDLSLAADMAAASTACRDYGADPTEALTTDQLNPDEKDIVKQIQLLADILLDVRGSPYKQNGSRKLLGEHGIVEVQEKFRKKASRNK